MSNELDKDSLRQLRTCPMERPEPAVGVVARSCLNRDR